MLLDKVRPGVAAFDEEPFGPMAALIETKNETGTEIQLVYQSDFGPGSALWTQDLDRADGWRGRFRRGQCS